MNIQSSRLLPVFIHGAGDRLFRVCYRFFFATTALATLTMVACVDDLSTGTQADMTPPTVDYVVARDAYHIDVEFSEFIGGARYSIVETAVSSPSGAQPSAPGDRIIIAGVSLSGETASIWTTTSMAGRSLKLTVSSLYDAMGNTQTRPIVKQFTGSSTPDDTPPQLAYQLPLPNTLNAPVQGGVALRFAEPATPGSFNGGASWVSDQGPVTFTVYESSGFIIVLTPSEALAHNSVQTIKLTGIQDYAGNIMPDVEWSFTTEP